MAEPSDLRLVDRLTDMVVEVAKVAWFQKAVDETPFAIVLLESIDITAGADWLQREAFQLLMDSEIADRSRLPARGFDVDDDVGNLMPRARRPVPVALDPGCEVLFDALAGAGG